MFLEMPTWLRGNSSDPVISGYWGGFGDDGQGDGTWKAVLRLRQREPCPGRSSAVISQPVLGVGGHPRPASAVLQPSHATFDRPGADRPDCAGHERAVADIKRGRNFVVHRPDSIQFKATNDMLGHPIGDALLRDAHSDSRRYVHRGSRHGRWHAHKTVGLTGGVMQGALCDRQVDIQGVEFASRSAGNSPMLPACSIRHPKGKRIGPVTAGGTRSFHRQPVYTTELVQLVLRSWSVGTGMISTVDPPEP